MQKNSLAEVEAQIAETKKELKNVHGTEAEVYARIVGYYRPVRNWNKGKSDEYKTRELYQIDDCVTNDKITIEIQEEPKETEKTIEVQNEATLFDKEPQIEQKAEQNSSLRYEFFSRTTCPNCPPVRAFLANKITDKVVSVDVDTEKGLARASELGVFAAPTVILFNGSNEIGRAHSTNELEDLVKKIA